MECLEGKCFHSHSFMEKFDSKCGCNFLISVLLIKDGKQRQNNSKLSIHINTDFWDGKGAWCDADSFFLQTGLVLNPGSSGTRHQIPNFIPCDSFTLCLSQVGRSMETFLKETICSAFSFCRVLWWGIVYGINVGSVKESPGVKEIIARILHSVVWRGTHLWLKTCSHVTFARYTTQVVQSCLYIWSFRVVCTQEGLCVWTVESLNVHLLFAHTPDTSDTYLEHMQTVLIQVSSAILSLRL